MADDRPVYEFTVLLPLDVDAWPQLIIGENFQGTWQLLEIATPEQRLLPPEEEEEPPLYAHSLPVFDARSDNFDVPGPSSEHWDLSVLPDPQRAGSPPPYCPELIALHQREKEMLGVERPQPTQHRRRSLTSPPRPPKLYRRVRMAQTPP